MKKEEEKQSVENSIDKIINDAMKNLKNMVDSNVVIGEPMTMTDGTNIIPISKVLVGVVCGGGEINNSKKKATEYPFAGGSGAGYTIVPIGVLAGARDNYNFIPIETKNIYSDLMITVNDILKTIKKESIDDKTKK